MLVKQLLNISQPTGYHLIGLLRPKFTVSWYSLRQVLLVKANLEDILIFYLEGTFLYFNMSPLWLVLTLVSIVSAAVIPRDDDWDFLLLAQFWPSTSCIYFKHQCDVPEKVNNWTIHGLWPSRAQEPQPENCNKSMPFDYSEIESLRERLDVEWPYYNKSGERTYLWEHEWNKHGTCANTLSKLSGELLYFSQAMNLYQTLDISGVLKNAGIQPSNDQTYEAKEFYDALVSHFAVKPNIVCLFNSGEKAYYIEEIYLCYTKDLTMRDCEEIPSRKGMDPALRFISEKSNQIEDFESYIQDCPKNGGVKYLPIQH